MELLRFWLDFQEQYTFLRTNKGYKLIGVSWRNP